MAMLQGPNSPTKGKHLPIFLVQKYNIPNYQLLSRSSEIMLPASLDLNSRDTLSCYCFHERKKSLNVFKLTIPKVK